MYGGFQLTVDGACVLCRQTAIPVLVSAKGDDAVAVGVCEPCARLADWRFRDVKDSELAGVPFPTVPGAALVLIFRDRLVDGHPDTLAPYDVLMVERKDEPGKFGLPGGKLEKGEASVSAAVRELGEEAGITAWRTSLDLLYSGFSARGRLVDTFLCRAYAGVPVAVEGYAVEWKPWPPSDHVGVLRGYYRGLEGAFEARVKLHKEVGNEAPLCQRLGKSALEHVTEGFKGEGRDREYMMAMTYVMTEEEKQASNVVLSEVNAPKPVEAKQAPGPDDDEPGEEDYSEVGDVGDGVRFNDDEREGPGK